MRTITSIEVLNKFTHSGGIFLTGCFVEGIQWQVLVFLSGEC